MILQFLAGGLRVIPYRVLLDVVAWLGLSYSICTPVNSGNAMALVFTIGMANVTCGMTKRWPITFPMMPIVLLQLSRCIGPGFENSRLLRYPSMLLVLVSMGLAVLFPPLQLPKVGGPYAVGGVKFFLPIDTTADNANDACPVMFNHTHVHVKLLYPTSLQGDDSNNHAKTMPYLSPSMAVDFLQESMKAAAPPPLKTYDWLMHHWLLTELPIQQNATLLASTRKERFPLVVYSHGLMGNADLYSYQAMSLAARGNLVLMVDHLDGSAPVAEHADGKRVTFDYEIVQLWHDGKKEEYVRERRSRTDWRVHELIGATESFLKMNEQEAHADFLTKEAPHLNLSQRIQTDRVFFMGHSFGGATALTAAHRRPDLLEGGGGAIAHEPAVDWMPDDARRSLLPLDRLKGLDSAQNYTGGTGGLEYSHNESVPPISVHDQNLFILFSAQWRQLKWGHSDVLEEMHRKGSFGPMKGVSDYGIVDCFHNEFSDMCMLTPLWLARGTGATGPRNPIETAGEIEERTWAFVSSVLKSAPLSSNG